MNFQQLVKGQETVNRLSQAFYEFCGTTGVHGLDLVHQGQPLVLRIFWIFCTVGGTLGQFYPARYVKWFNTLEIFQPLC